VWCTDTRAAVSLEPWCGVVQSILRHRFGAQIQTSPGWSDMPRTIAQTLWESPDAHQRLDRLWDRLAGVGR
jgi:hypothetical protein